MTEWKPLWREEQEERDMREAIVPEVADIFGRRRGGKSCEQLIKAQYWCRENPGKKLVIAFENGGLEMTFRENSAPADQPESVQKIAELESQVVELTEWKNSAMIQLGKADKLQAILPPKYLGRDVYEAAVEELRELTARLENARDARDLALDRGSKLGREVINLRASVERLTASRNDLELAANSYMKQIQQHVDFLAERNALIAELRGEKAKELAMTMRPTEISRATELAKLMYNADHFKIAYEDHLKICPGPPMLLPSCYIEQSKQIRELTAELSREIGKSSVLRKTIERLTGTLKSVLASASPNPKNHPAMTEAWRNARTVLAEKGLTGELKEARK